MFANTLHNFLLYRSVICLMMMFTAYHLFIIVYFTVVISNVTLSQGRTTNYNITQYDTCNNFMNMDLSFILYIKFM